MREFEESKHPRDSNGQFKEEGAADNEKIKKLERIYNTNENHLTNSTGSGMLTSYPKAKGFRNNADRRDHKKHVREVGFKAFSEYEKRAVEIINNKHPGEEVFIKKSDRAYKYLKDTNELVIVGLGGNLISYFKPKNKYRYFQNIKDGGKKNV